MSSDSKGKPKVRRPGGRTARNTRDINRAVIELIVEGGASACTAANVAERAGVERSTIYRRYPDRWEMITEVFVEHYREAVTPPFGGNFRTNLRAVLEQILVNLKSPIGAAMLIAAGELSTDRSSDLPRLYFDRRMEQLQPMFDKAIADGELSANADHEEIYTYAAGAVYYRYFIASREVTDAFLDRLVEAVMTLFAKG